MIKFKLLWMGVFCFLVASFYGCACTTNHSMNMLEPGDPEEVIGRYPEMADNEGMVMVQAIGKGVAPDNEFNRGRAIIMAERAAIADAYRQLAEKIKGVYIRSYQDTWNGSVDQDFIRLKTETWLRGARVDKINHIDHGIVEAHMVANMQLETRCNNSRSEVDEEK